MKFTAKRIDPLTDHFFVELNTRIFEMEAGGKDVIRLDIGSPDLPPAPHIIKALAQSAASYNHHGYQPHIGPKNLREAWSGLYKRLYQIDLNPDSEVIPLIGSKEGIFNLVMACIDPGDLVLIPDPGYVTYSKATLFAGGELYPVVLNAERNFLPDLNQVPAAVLQRAKMIWLNYPNNPTAATANPEFFNEVVAIARQHDLLVCHDAAYSQVTFDGYKAPSILQAPGACEIAVEFNTLSKSHNMAGWRVGAALGHPQALQSLYTLKTNIDSGQFLPIMEAATTALTADQSWLIDRNETYRQRRDVIITALHSLGLNAQIPRGSLYVWSPVPGGRSAADFASQLLEEARVSLTPGTVFGPSGEGYIRISLTAPMDRIEAAMQRLREFLEASERVAI
jgi:LL-diaminopimelate aminotransferase